MERAVDSKDNRYNQIHITEKGLEMARYSIAVFEETEQIMFQTLGELLDRIYDNLESCIPEKEEHGNEEHGR